MSRAIEEGIMSWFSGGIHVAVHHANPGLSGAALIVKTEQPVPIGAFSMSRGIITNTREILVGICPRGTRLTHGSLFLGSGSFLIGGRLKTPVIAIAGDPVVVSPGDITFRVGIIRG